MSEYIISGFGKVFQNLVALKENIGDKYFLAYCSWADGNWESWQNYVTSVTQNLEVTWQTE